MQKHGLIQVTGWVHADQAADALLYLKDLKEHPHLIPGPLRDPVSGRLVRRTHT